MAKIAFDWRSRRFRMALVVGLAVVVAVVAWRVGEREKPECAPERVEERDAAGRVVSIHKVECLGDD